MRSGQEVLLPARFKAYVVGVMRGEPVSVPDATPEEWDEFLASLARNRLQPLLFWHIASSPTHPWPPEPVVERLRSEFSAGHIRMLQIRRQLAGLLRALERSGVQPIVLKGPALAFAIYPHPATRSSTDIDLLVHREQLEAAHVILLKLGYTCPERRYSDLRREIYKDDLYLPGAKNLCPVELHWGLEFFSGAQREEEAGLFGRAVRTESADLAFWTLGGVDSLCYAAHHGQVHHGRDSRLVWALDVALLAQKFKAPEQRAELRQAVRTKTSPRVLVQALELAQEWLGQDSGELLGELRYELSSGEGSDIELNFRRGWLRQVLAVVGERRSEANLWSRLSFLWRLLFPAAQTIAKTYPPRYPWLLPLSYLRRWFAWLREPF